MLRVAGLVLALAVLVVVCILSVRIGSRSIPLPTVLDALWAGPREIVPGTMGGDEAFIVWNLRVPRTIIGLFAGAALGLAGALMQAVTRNPLADSGLLGVDVGASTAIVFAIAFAGIATVTGYVWFSFVGAALVSVVVYLLGSTGRAVTPERMVLAGAAISAVLGAVISAVLLLDPATFQAYRFWSVGSLASRGLDVAVGVAPFLIAGFLLGLGVARPLNALALGDDAGRALGARVERTRLVAAAAITLLCGAATAAAGPIGFVGLTVPHIARMIVGTDQRWVLPYTMVLAPILVLSADVVGRVIVAPAEMEVGIITAFVGAPVFIALSRRRRIVSL
ncbi:MAG: ABC transporter permease [Pseudonocardia sp. SCN 72-86]|nr:MAG: ABC transporter permease [Pseudonocardia sp. SCN 72-86]